MVPALLDAPERPRLLRDEVGHLFRPEQLLPFDACSAAAAELTGGASVTTAAHGAGFSDSAHLTRTFRRMLGTTPSEIARRADVTRVVAVQVN